MELNVGDYVRTKYGISKIVAFYSNAIYNEKNKRIDNNLITKSSPNIIDLIEVGDYVNGWRVNRIEKQEGGIFFTIGNITSFISKNETNPYLTRDHNDKNRICKIESIVTKEQFEAMQYVIKED